MPNRKKLSAAGAPGDNKGMTPLHIGIAACSAEGAALCYRTICTEAPAFIAPTVLDPTVPVGSQIAEKLRSVRPEWNPRECRERVMQLLSEVRIPSPKERYWDYPSKFSGGMMQRAMIVDAICAEPAVLIADNITQPLDVTIAAQIVALLHDLCIRHKTATIYLSSSLPTLGQFGAQTAILHQGRFVEQQAFAELMASPKADYTNKAIASVPRMWSTAEGPLARRQAQGEVPLMKVQNVYATESGSQRARREVVDGRESHRPPSVDCRHADVPLARAGSRRLRRSSQEAQRRGLHRAQRNVARRAVVGRTDPEAQ